MNPKDNDVSDFSLLVFDLDGVLVDTVSSWVWMHDHFKVNNDISHEQYMRNEIDDQEFMRRDIALWLSKKPRFHIDEVRMILSKIPLMPGFHETMNTLKQLGIELAIVSSGLEPLAQQVGGSVGMKHILANGLELDANGNLTGEGILHVALRSKGEPVEMLQTELCIDKSSTIAIGNGETDIPMFEASGFSIAFDPLSSKVVENADVAIYEKDLTNILSHIRNLQ